ncbi:MAG: flagellar biosynthesis protein FlgE [Curvibacter sp. RIFCSPHIGHO2_12_FULL_63_18]|uniref:flagellar hook protein FlgE n=1 Tax=Rhodoferax sp. TaxID=50421 RepID=UPI0008C30544|nr:flagellar hook protein FlgE [Rhodoferax sp.]OGO98886.1 MAG: flagellar biosynthesis protein FlgE [Curvibacter sp. GWA2_63_95]OGP06248.1 MAG: flagellar biosynthesis protein FlgE [Curvibacter sp. RIFCSPHIGHO2_12_FULL_63_18]HCX83135.1 flagellar hook protein FlgE [Rhodoferax sp.]
MSFQTGLSGLNASSKSLDVIGNNIANANTVGMKSSRAEFADLVASSLGAAGGASKGAGIGVSVATIAQQFSQGNINITGNSLDVAINGGGFFQVTMPDGSTAFTRDGQFKLDRDGNILTNTGANVMGYPTDLLGNSTSVTPQIISIPTGAPIPAQVTTEITAEFNLDARAKVAASVTPPTPISTYGTSLTAFDSQGVEVPVSLYFVKTGPDLTANPAVAADTWEVFDSTTLAAGTTALATNAATYATHNANSTWNTANPGPDQRATFAAAGTGIYAADPQLTTVAAGSLFQMTFDVNGGLVTPAAPQTLTLTSPNVAIGNFNATLDLSGATQYGTAFTVSNLTQDGYTAGELTGISIDPSGVIMTRYSNGESQAQGKIALADFRNVQGLTPTGGGNWVETFASGQPVLGEAGIGKFGELRAGALEDSNVDLTAELVNMMTAQRNYQANAQTIKTQDQIMSTLVNLR